MIKSLVAKGVGVGCVSNTWLCVPHWLKMKKVIRFFFFFYEKLYVHKSLSSPRISYNNRLGVGLRIGLGLFLYK